MIKLLCKWFNLIYPLDLISKLSELLYRMAMSKKVLKKKYDDKEISEWTFYKKLWMLKGRLQMLEEIVNSLSRKGN